MTDEDCARLIIDQMFLQSTWEQQKAKGVKIIAAALRQARQEEREACALLVEMTCSSRRKLAAAIRKRGDTP